ncbi:MAG: hypothetical protein ACUVQW_04510 [Candidatus Bathycorpusculaceae bacterium]
MVVEDARPTPTLLQAHEQSAESCSEVFELCTANVDDWFNADDETSTTKRVKFNPPSSGTN